MAGLRRDLQIGNRGAPLVGGTHLSAAKLQTAPLLKK